MSKQIIKGLVAAWNLTEYATDKGAYVSRGGDHYIEKSDLHKALCEAFGLNYFEAKRSELEAKIAEFRRE